MAGRYYNEAEVLRSIEAQVLEPELDEDMEPVGIFTADNPPFGGEDR